MTWWKYLLKKSPLKSNFLARLRSFDPLTKFTTLLLVNEQIHVQFLPSNGVHWSRHLKVFHFESHSWSNNSTHSHEWPECGRIKHPRRVSKPFSLKRKRIMSGVLTMTQKPTLNIKFENLFYVILWCKQKQHLRQTKHKINFKYICSSEWCQFCVKNKFQHFISFTSNCL